MRPYSNAELEILATNERLAASIANRKVGYNPTKDEGKARWNEVFHREIEAQAIQSGLHKPRDFFRQGAKRHGFDRY